MALWRLPVVLVLGGLIFLPLFWRAGEAPNDFNWQPYEDALFEEAITAGQPIIVDFYAEWCGPCIQMDRSTFSKPKIQEAFKDFVRLRADLTYAESPKAIRISRKFNIENIPTLFLFIPRENHVDETRLEGFTTARELLTIVNDKLA